MQAIILAAGRGTRLGVITERIPKSMIVIQGKPLLAHIIDQLPSAVDNVLIVIGYHGDAIQKYFGEHYAGKALSYFSTPVLNGTGGALFAAREFLDERFLVLNGDDLIGEADIKKIIDYPLAIGVWEGKPNHNGYLDIDMTESGIFKGFRKPADFEYENGIRVATGAFVLDKRIFDEELVVIGNGELGLPQTVARMAKHVAVHVVSMPSWKTITYPEDISVLEEHLVAKS